jgi:riboflavin synthase
VGGYRFATPRPTRSALTSPVFTGIIEFTGRIASIEPSPAGKRLVIQPSWGIGPEEGESIAVNGCCLTVVETVGPGEPVAFDVIPETLSKTTLGGLEPGRAVHLERSATASTLMGGHVVQGHVEAVGRVARIVRPEDEGSGGEWRMRVATPADLMPCMVPKGSVAIEGVSLTIAAANAGDETGGWFEVALIPTTLGKTELGRLDVGDGVNLETDLFARTVVHAMTHFADRLGTARLGLSAPTGR